MSAINMWLFDLNSEITIGDSLTNKWSKKYITRKGGYIWEIDNEQPEKAESIESEPIKQPDIPSS